MNGRTNLPIKKWKVEAAQLTAEKNQLYQDFYKLGDEVREVEIIKRNMEQVVQADAPKHTVTMNKGMELWFYFTGWTGNSLSGLVFLEFDLIMKYNHSV